MNADGKCLCGQIQVEADIDSTTTTICQRTDCRINSGTTFGYVVGAVNNIFKLLKGKLSFYNKIVDSGAKRELAFCGVCGTRIDARPVEGKLVFFGLGLIYQTKKNTTTQRQAWKKPCLDWVEFIETELTFEGQPRLSS